MPRPTTFRPLAEPTYGVMKRINFLLSLDNWATQPRAAFSTLAPPVDAMADDFCDENAILAAVFYRLAKAEGLTGQIALIQLELFHHNRRYGIAWDHAEGEADPRRRPQRATYFDLKPYEDMIAVIENWAEALHQRACEVAP